MGSRLRTRVIAVVVAALMAGALGAASTSAASASITFAGAAPPRTAAGAVSSRTTTSVAPPRTTVPDAGTAEYPAVETTRVAGADRYATAAAMATASNIGVPAPTTGGTVFLTTGTNYPDAIVAAPVAAKLSAPVLLTAPTWLPAVTAKTLTALAPTQIVVLGGTGSVSAGVEAAAHAAAPAARITRIGGSDRYATARAIVQWAMAHVSAPFAPAVFVATGGGFSDALSAAAAAGAQNQPVILAAPGTTVLDAATVSLIHDLGTTRATIVGGPSVVSSGIQSQLALALGAGAVTRVFGADASATSAAVAGTMPASPRTFLTSRASYADALAGAAVAARARSPLVSIAPACVPTAAAAYVHARTTSAVILGGTGALASTIEGLVPCSTASLRVASSTAVGALVSNGDGGPYMGLDGISCASASRCVAVGVRNGRPVAATLSSGRWSLATLPVPTGYQGPSFDRVLTAVSCTTAARCVASGTYDIADSHQRGLIEIFNGSTWTATSVAPPSGSPASTDVSLTTISCAGTSCAATESLNPSPEAAAVDIEGDAVEPTAVLGDGWLTSASCTATGSCLLGGYDVGTGHPLSGYLVNGGWVPVPEPTDVGGGFVALTCAAAGACTGWAGIGYAVSHAGEILKLQGGVWIADATVRALPVGTVTDVSVNSETLACADIDFCAAALGASTGSSWATPQLAVVSNHQAVVSNAPLPPGVRVASAAPQIELLACPRLGTCIAIGEYRISTTEMGLFADVLSDGVWSVHTLPHPANQEWVDMLNPTAISCPTSSTCHIAGDENFIRTPNVAAEYAGFDVALTF